MSLTKRVRFEVFKRDGFKCQYCGQTPPAVTLEVDHINPKAEGGEDDINNLITACFDCNRGKGARTLDQAPPTLTVNIELIAEKEEQVKAYNRLLATQRKRERKTAERVNDVYKSAFPEWELSDKFINTSLSVFIKSISEEKLIEAMQIACMNIRYNSGGAIRYFCGICWRIIKGNSNV
jgi:CRISPR/Cas system Type II protein with McrA/HNH and RuvC-like nuclease domain